MRMSTMLNNTRVRNSLDCPDNNTFAFIGCQGSSGSVYDTTRGTFNQVVNIQDWNVTTVDEQPDDGETTVLHGYDVANFTDGPAVAYGYPFEVWADYDAANKSAVAFGPNSSTLDSFLRNDVAPARTFGLDYGSTSELHPRDGQLVVGGYNEARFDASRVSSFPMWAANAPTACPLQVTIADIILTNVDGDHPLTDPGARLAACIDTVHNSFAFTPAIYDRFQSIGNTGGAGAGGGNSTDAAAPGEEAFDESDFPVDREPLIGTLTIRLSNGYTTVIPHYELVNHVRGTDSRGKYAVLNNTRLSTTVSSGASDLGDNIPVLGGVFLSQNYLHVDYDAATFWLSPQVANGTRPDRITASCNATSADDGDSRPPAFAVQVGVPVAVGASVVFSVGMWVWLRRRKRRARTRPADAPRSSIIPRNEKRDAPGTSSSTAMLMGYGFADGSSAAAASSATRSAADGHRAGRANNNALPTKFEGYDTVHHANPGAHMELEGDLGLPAGQRAELEEPAPPYKAEWPRQNSVQGENAGYYKQFEEAGEAYELADTSTFSSNAAAPPLTKRQEAGLSQHWTPTFVLSQRRTSAFSDAVSPTSEGTNTTNILAHVSPV
ncbi:hypothetical protein LX36DRAFT_583120 [Colletotrichum falcatum]|nr:hypothetical protein LX36DRAFT_583120 [Colletotrichum falcatum]